MGIMLTLWALIFEKNRKFALILGLNTLVWMVFVFYLRPVFFGEIYAHGRSVLPGFVKDPIAYFTPYFNISIWRKILSLVIPLIPLSIWIYRKKIRPNWEILFILLPLIGIRFLMIKWTHHYGPPLCAGLIFILLPFKSNLTLPRWIIPTTLVLLLALNGKPYKHASQYFAGTMDHCPSEKPRLESIDWAVAFLMKNKEGPLLAQSNLIPTLIKRGEIYDHSPWQPVGENIYKYVFFEKPPRGASDHISTEEVEDLINHWRSVPQIRIIKDDEHVFLAQGQFKRDR